MSNIYQKKYSIIFHNNNIFKLKNLLPNKKTKNNKNKSIKKDSFNNIFINKNLNNTKKINNNLSFKEDNIYYNKSNSNDDIPFIFLDKSHKFKQNNELFILNLKELSNRLNKIFYNLKKKDYDNIFQKIKFYSFINENKIKKIKNKTPTNNNKIFYNINKNNNNSKIKQNIINLKNNQYIYDSKNNSKQNIKTFKKNKQNNNNNNNNNNIFKSNIVDNFKNNILFKNLNFFKFNNNDNVKTIQKDDKKDSFKKIHQDDYKNLNNILFQKKLNLKFKVHKEIISSYDNINLFDKTKRNKIIKIERLIDNIKYIDKKIIENENNENNKSNNINKSTEININYKKKNNLKDKFNSLNEQNICYSDNNILYNNKHKLNTNNDIINTKKISSINYIFNNKNIELKEINNSNYSSFYDSPDSEYENEFNQPKKGWLFLKIISFVSFHFQYRNFKKKFVFWKKLSNIKDQIIIENNLKYNH